MNDVYDVQEILVRMRITNGGGTLVEEKWTRTNGAGQYSMTWTAPHAFGVFISISVLPERPLLTTGQVTTSKPAHEFRILPRVVLSSGGFASTANGQSSTFNRNAGASEHMQAYRTTFDVYELYTNQGGIRQDMAGVTINVNSTNNITPTGSDVFLVTNFATADTWTISHELGHALNWRQWGLAVAPINPVVGDYFHEWPVGHSCGNESWSRFSCEWEKVAFAEGFADAHGTLYLWNRSAVPTGDCPGGQPHIPREGGIAMEGAGSCDGTAFDQRHPICNARALWDLVDNPAGDDDGITARDFTAQSDVLKSYPRNCICGFQNRCANEGDGWQVICLNDQNGANFRDFIYNWSSLFGGAENTALINIRNANALTQQDDG
jgi:hypothetical protein